MNKQLYDLYCVVSSGLQVTKGTVKLAVSKVNDCTIIEETGKVIGSRIPVSVDKVSADSMYRDLHSKSISRQSVRSYHTRSYTKSTKKYSTKTFDEPVNGLQNPNMDPFKKSSKSKKAKKLKVIGTKTDNFALQSSEVPSSRLSRIFHYGSLAAGMGIGMAQQGFKHYTSSEPTAPLSFKSLLLNPQNIERMAKKFSQMRGAALKIGQLLSFQDNSVLPKEVQAILLKVQNSAHYMPYGQLNKVMVEDIGENWRANNFTSFDDLPIAAASIGQVHNAVTKDLSKVVVKVQYPGVANSIDSDLNNILMFLTASSLLPAGLFLDKTIANARVELKWECDYIREAQNLIRFEDMVKDYPEFKVPKVYHNLCGEHVLTMEKMEGTEVVKGNWDQETKNWIATNIMKLCLLKLKNLDLCKQIQTGQIFCTMKRLNK